MHNAPQVVSALEATVETDTYAVGYIFDDEFYEAYRTFAQSLGESIAAVGELRKTYGQQMVWLEANPALKVIIFIAPS